MTICAPDPKLTAPTTMIGDRYNLSIAELLLEYLKLEGVTKLFGIPGGALIFLMEALKKQNSTFDFIICRHETGASYIAHGYALVSGGLGVVLTTSGPAATNALTGSMNAQCSDVSLLTITGEVAQAYYGQGYLQEGIDAKLNVDEIFRNAVEYSAVISSVKNFPVLFEQALRGALSVPRRAAHVSLPNDIASQCAVGAPDPQKGTRIPFPMSPENYRATASCTDVAKAKSTVDDLVAAKRPLLFLGNGAREALNNENRRTRFTAMVETFALPVMTTPDAKGIFPEGHALSLRSYGMCGCPWSTLYMNLPGDPNHFDALAVFGSALGELATTVALTDQYSKNLIPSGSFTQIDIDSSNIGRSFPITRGIVAEMGATIDAMCDYAATLKPNSTAVEARRQLIAGIKAANSPFADPAARASTSAPLHPAALTRVMNEVMKDGGHIFIDAGNCVGWSLHYLEINPPMRYHSALSMGPMGFGVGAVIGGKLAAPNLPCVALVGDGAFMMHGAEISTAAQNGIGAIWVVLNDNDLAMVSQGMGALLPEETGWQDYYKLGAPDLAKFSEGLGAEATTITLKQGTAQFEKALRHAIERGNTARKPQVIIAHIDTTAMPPYAWPNLTPLIGQCALPVR